MCFLTSTFQSRFLTVVAPVTSTSRNLSRCRLNAPSPCSRLDSNDARGVDGYGDIPRNWLGAKNYLGVDHGLIYTHADRHLLRSIYII